MSSLIHTLIRRLPPIKRLIIERDYLRVMAKSSGSAYEAPLAQAIAQGKHREAIGGRWKELGELQFAYLCQHGLKPNHAFLDIGCGSLRGGVKFIGYLEPGNYWGIDNSAALLDAGWSVELPLLDLQGRQPRAQLVCLADFEFTSLAHIFDYALAQSVFTHLNLNKIRLCLTRLAPAMKTGGTLLATFLPAPTNHPIDQPIKRLNITTYGHRDPFHYGFEDFEHVVRGLPWTVRNLGPWDHPANTEMLEFKKN